MMRRSQPLLLALCCSLISVAPASLAAGGTSGAARRSSVAVAGSDTTAVGPTDKPAAETSKPIKMDIGVPAASVTKDGDVLVAHDIPYIQDDKICIGDLYLPDSWTPSTDTRYPVVMVLHGGAWIIGSKTDAGEVDVSKRLAENGYVAFNINYHLIQDGGVYPSSMHQVRDAMAFLQSNADRLHLDMSRMGMFGASAGAMMALLAAYAPPEVAALKAEHYANVPLPKPKAVVVYSAVTDIRNLEKTWIFKYMDDTPWHAVDRYAEASPVVYAKTAVPTLAVYGSNDPLVPIEQSLDLVKTLNAAGVPAEAFVIPKSRHVFHEDPGPKRELAFGKLLDWFNKNVK